MAWTNLAIEVQRNETGKTQLLVGKPFSLVLLGFGMPAWNGGKNLHVFVHRPLRTVRVLDGPSGHLEPGQLLAIMGPSGSGKSTLLKSIAGIGELALLPGPLLTAHCMARRVPEACTSVFLLERRAKILATCLTLKTGRGHKSRKL